MRIPSGDHSSSSGSAGLMLRSVAESVEEQVCYEADIEAILLDTMSRWGTQMHYWSSETSEEAYRKRESGSSRRLEKMW